MRPWSKASGLTTEVPSMTRQLLCAIKAEIDGICSKTLIRYKKIRGACASRAHWCCGPSPEVILGSKKCGRWRNSRGLGRCRRHLEANENTAWSPHGLTTPHRRTTLMSSSEQLKLINDIGSRPSLLCQGERSPSAHAMAARFARSSVVRSLPVKVAFKPASLVPSSRIPGCEVPGS